MEKTGSGFLCQDEVLVRQIGLERRGYVARLTPQSKALKGAAEAVSQLTVLIEVEVFAVDGRSFHDLALHAQKGASPCKLHLAHGQLVYAAQVAGNACEQVPEPSRRPAADLAIKEKLLPVGHSRPALLPTLHCQHVAFGLRRGCAVSLGMRHELVTPCDRCANCAVCTQDIAPRKIVNDRTDLWRANRGISAAEATRGRERGDVMTSKSPLSPVSAAPRRKTNSLLALVP